MVATILLILQTCLYGLLQQHIIAISVYRDLRRRFLLESGGEDLLNRHTLALRFDSILVQYGLPPKLDEEHTKILVEEYPSRENIWN